MSKAAVFVLIMIVIGGCVIFAGVQEYRVGKDSSADPVDVPLADLEGGKALPDNHIRIGEHHRIYATSVYEYEYEDDDAREKPSSKVKWTYYPEDKYDSLKKVPRGAKWPALKSFAVLVKTERFATIGDIPRKRKFIKSVQGLVINRIETLGDDEKRLIRSEFPKIDFDKIFVLEQDRKPETAATSIGMMVAGGAVAVIPLGVLVLLRIRRSRRLPEDVPGPQEPQAEEQEPQPEEQEPQAEEQEPQAEEQQPPPEEPPAAPDDDKNPYRQL